MPRIWVPELRCASVAQRAARGVEVDLCGLNDMEELAGLIMLFIDLVYMRHSFGLYSVSDLMKGWR